MDRETDGELGSILDRPGFVRGKEKRYEGEEMGCLRDRQRGNKEILRARAVEGLTCCHELCYRSFGCDLHDKEAEIEIERRCSGIHRILRTP